MLFAIISYWIFAIFQVGSAKWEVLSLTVGQLACLRIFAQKSKPDCSHITINDFARHNCRPHLCGSGGARADVLHFDALLWVQSLFSTEKDCTIISGTAGEKEMHLLREKIPLMRGNNCPQNFASLCGRTGEKRAIFSELLLFLTFWYLSSPCSPTL